MGSRTTTGGWLAAAAVALGLALAPSGQAIVGGQPATQDHPHMAQLRFDGDFICGASLVRANWVLTAAHCVEDAEGAADADRFAVILGRKRLSDDGGETLAVKEVRIHPAYAGNGSDIALLRLAAPSAQTPVRMVTLAERGAWAPGVTATVTGWGAQMSGGGASNELREVQVPIRNDETCASSSYAIFGYEADTMLCAGDTFGGRDSCQGDSGGPLTVPDAAGKTVLAGVVSSGVGCAFPASYGVYARIGDEKLSGWLDENLPAAGTGTPPPQPQPGGDPSGEPAPSSSPRVEVLKRLRKRGRRVRIVLRSNVELSRVRVKLVRRGRTYAKARLATLDGRTKLKPRLRRKLRGGRYTVSVRGANSAGERLRLAAGARR